MEQLGTIASLRAIAGSGNGFFFEGWGCRLRRTRRIFWRFCRRRLRRVRPAAAVLTTDVPRLRPTSHILRIRRTPLRSFRI